MRRRIYEYYSGRGESRKVKDSTIYATLARLREKGLVSKKSDGWKLTEKGKTFYEQVQIKRKRDETMRRNRKREKGMIIAFDVPEHERYKRDWLREELVVLGFEPIQQSVWFGPAPLPEEFIEHLDKQGLVDCVRFFRVSENDLV